MQPSQRWTLNATDFKRIGKNALIFLAPVAITELTMLSQGITNWHLYGYAFEVWLVGVLLDFFRKLQANG